MFVEHFTQETYDHFVNQSISASGLMEESQPSLKTLQQHGIMHMPAPCAVDRAETRSFHAITRIYYDIKDVDWSEWESVYLAFKRQTTVNRVSGDIVSQYVVRGTPSDKYL